jgi:hypothetical protein
MSLIFKPVLILNAEEEPSEATITPNTDYCICLTPDQVQNRNLHLLKLFYKSRYKLSICLDLGGLSSIGVDQLNDVTNFLVLLSFSLNYSKHNGLPLLALLKDEDSNIDLYKRVCNKIENLFSTQGYEDFKLHQIDECKSTLEDSGLGNYYADLRNGGDQELFIQKLTGLYSGNLRIGSFLFIRSSAVALSRKLLEKFTKIDKDFGEMNIKVYSQMTEIRDLTKERDRLRLDYKQAMIKKRDYEQNQAHLRRESQSVIDWYKAENEKIKDWYYKEYEALPLWYKWIGHILKRVFKFGRKKRSQN